MDNILWKEDKRKDIEEICRNNTTLASFFESLDPLMDAVRRRNTYISVDYGNFPYFFGLKPNVSGVDAIAICDSSPTAVFLSSFKEFEFLQIVAEHDYRTHGTLEKNNNFRVYRQGRLLRHNILDIFKAKREMHRPDLIYMNVIGMLPPMNSYVAVVNNKEGIRFLDDYLSSRSSLS